MEQQANPPLPAGFQLEEYQIERQLSVGGFSIVYIARDPEGNAVAIKEYLPNTLALRTADDPRIQVPEFHQKIFRFGLKCFFEEGKALAKLSHPNVVRVLNFLKANDTVYMVMQYEEGQTLHDLIQKHDGPLPEDFLRGTFTQLLNGLREVHAHKLLHLDIKPANIYLRTDGSPLLIDFGAARYMLNDAQQALKPIFTPGYASPEHHDHRELLGPWSDIYSIGATLYACLSYTTPQAADERLINDQIKPAMVAWEGKYSDRLLEIVDWCMNTNYQYRPQSVYALQQALVNAVFQQEKSEESGWFSRIISKLSGGTP